MPVNISGSGATGSINTAILPSSGTFATQSYADTAGGLVKIATETFSAVTSVSVNNCFTSTYDNYKILIVHQASGDGVAFQMRLRVSGSDNTSSTYNVERLTADSTTLSSLREASQSSWCIGNTDNDDDAGAVNLEIFRPNVATRTSFLSHSISPYVGAFLGVGGGYFDNSTVFDGFTIYPTSGTITGTVRVYGYRN